MRAAYNTGDSCACAAYDCSDSSTDKESQYFDSSASRRDTHIGEKLSPSCARCAAARMLTVHGLRARTAFRDSLTFHGAEAAVWASNSALSVSALGVSVCKSEDGSVLRKPI